MTTSSSNKSTISTREMQNIVEKLRMERYRSSTRRIYHIVWKAFNSFYLRLDHRPKSWEDRFTLYVAYLIQCDKQSATIRSYVSAIKVVLWEDGYKVTEDQYLI